MRALQYPVGIIGAGAWGTALATVMQQAHGDALIWAHEAEVVHSINTDRRNHLYLPSIDLAEGIRATGDITEMANCHALMLVAPAQHREELHKTLTPGERAHDKLMFIDAGEQLQKFMVDDWPSEFRFKN